MKLEIGRFVMGAEEGALDVTDGSVRKAGEI